MGAYPFQRVCRMGNAARLAASASLVTALLGACVASPSSGPPTEQPTAVTTGQATATPQPSQTPTLSPGAVWTSIDWTASDPGPFSGQGNQYIFGGVPWAAGSVLVGEEAPLPTGNVEGVVWASTDNVHWHRIPNTSGTFSSSEIEAVAASGSTLVAVGSSRREDSATTLTPPVGIVWVSSDGSHWQRVPDENGILGNLVLHGVVAGSSGFLAYGNGLTGGAALAFSPDGLHWQREGDDPVFADSSIAAISWTGQGYAAVGSHQVAQPSGVLSQMPGQAAAWWSTDGQTWHQSDVGSGAYQIESVQPWVHSLRAIGVPPCFGCVGPPLEWRSTDDGRSWHQLPPPATPNVSESTAILVGERAVGLQDQPQKLSWSADGQTWIDLSPTGSSLPSGTQLLMASGPTLIAFAGVNGASANDQEDMRVYAGTLQTR
jgi:hypothetical protein